MIEVIPAILTDSSLKFKELLLKLEPYTTRVHVDIADGVFVPNTTIKGYDEIKEIESAVKFDVHLMVQRPQDNLKEWFYTHADRFIVHVESETDIGDVVKKLKEHKRKVGLALNPETSIEKIEPYLPRTSRSKASGKPVNSYVSRSKASGDGIDFVQFLTVHPGFQGGEFVSGVLDKVREFHKKYPKIPIAVDGSMHVETAKLAVSAGASIIVVGGHILFENKGVEDSIRELKEACTT